MLVIIIVYVFYLFLMKILWGKVFIIFFICSWWFLLLEFVWVDFLIDIVINYLNFLFFLIFM